MFLFEVEGIRLHVVKDDETFLAFGVNGIQHPAAAVSKTQLDGFNGHVIVTSAFFNLTEATQTALLTHEAGHVACGHLDLVEAQTENLLINAQLEAEADAWATVRVGNAFDVAVMECSEYVARVYAVSDDIAELFVKETNERIALRDAWMAK